MTITHPFFFNNYFNARFLEAAEFKVQEVRQEMMKLYPDLTVEEWVTQHVTPVLKPIQDLLTDIQAVLEDMGHNITESQNGV